MAILGLDIGGTKRVLAVADDAGRIRASERRPMRQSGDWRRDLAAIVSDARELLAGAGVGAREPLVRVGVSVPGPVDAGRGLLLNPPNLEGWEEVPIGAALAQDLGAEVRVENDANAAVLAEATFGAGRGIDDLVYLTMSTGVGAGILSGGQLLRGAFGGAGEAGHFPVEWRGRRCACGLCGCFEAYVGGNAWRDQLRDSVSPSGRIAELAGGARASLTPEHVVAAAREGDPEAKEVFGAWLDRLAQGIVTLVMLVEPKRILLGTIAVAAGESLCFAPLRERLGEELWPQQARQLEVLPAALGDELPARAGLAIALRDAP